MKLNKLHLAAALALCGAAVSAQAATMTLNGFTYTTGHSVGATDTSPAPDVVFNGGSGGFSGKLENAGSANTANLLTYCVELTQNIQFNVENLNYTVVTASSYFDATKRQKLEKLISYVLGAAGVMSNTNNDYKDEQSSALQLAIWNTVYDTDNTTTGGNFTGNLTYSNGVTGQFIGANDLLQNAANQTQISYSLYVLASGNPYFSSQEPGGKQDQLFWVAGGGGGNPLGIPEPGSIALSLAALGGLAFASRRRSASASASARA